MKNHFIVSAKIVAPGRAEIECACRMVMLPPAGEVCWVLQLHKKAAAAALDEATRRKAMT